MSKHGTYSMYNQGCRCKLCKKAKALYVREWRREGSKRRLLEAEPYRLIALDCVERTGETMNIVAHWAGVSPGTLRDIINGKQTMIRYPTAVKIKGLENE